MDESSFKHQVIIVGGGITGLTLAVAFERLGVDYVLLEAYGSVTPNVGASIGLFAHGLRILDQLGIFDDFKPYSFPGSVTQLRNGETGTKIMTTSINTLLEKRHGYLPTFTNRHLLVSILHNHIRDKDKLLVKKKRHRALVHLEDGLLYEAQLVIGADGIHSTVRKEMWRNADANDPATIPKGDRKPIRNDYACVFGAGGGTPETNASTSFLLCNDPVAGLTYYLSWVLPKSQRQCPIDQITRLTKDEEKAALNRLGDMVVNDNGVRVRDVVDSCKKSGSTTLPCYALRRWGYGRIVILGDAAHKPNPLSGQGGNSCIESCAALVNTLQDQLGPKLADEPAWGVDRLAAAFRALERERVDRVTAIVEGAQERSASMMWRTFWGKLMQKYVAPLLPVSAFASLQSKITVGGVRLRGAFEKPKAKAEWLYDDEKLPRSDLPLVSVSVVTLGLCITALFATKLYNPITMGMLVQ
ncbi:hypothetical protein PG989_000121 [Apiospora arundinis]